MQANEIERSERPRHLISQGQIGWRRSARGRVMRTATAAVLAGLLSFPGTAFAAEWITVDGSDPMQGGADTNWSGEGLDGGYWSWDGFDALTLDNYNGGPIEAWGTLNVDLVGDNSIVGDVNNAGTNIVGMEVHSDDDPAASDTLTITGEGSLTIDSDGYGIRADDTADIAISGKDDGTKNDQKVGPTVAIDAEDCGIHTEAGDITISNGSNVTVSGDDVAAIHAGWNGDGAVKISDSTVSATNTYRYAIEGGYEYTKDPSAVFVSIINSDVTATGVGHAIFSNGAMLIENSDITASTSESGLASMAAEGSSQGAAIAAKEKIIYDDTTNFIGLELCKDSVEGKYFLGTSDGTTATAASSVATKHTGTTSQFINGVGREKTQTPGTGRNSTSTSGSATTSSTGTANTVATARLASTGGDVAGMVSNLATAVTSDPTSFTAAFAALFGGLGLTISGIASKRRSK